MSPSDSPTPGSPHVVSLVLHSKKALQHGEQLCTRAHELSRATAQVAAELLALDAKIRWAKHGIAEQMKLAGSLARNIEVQRQRLEEQAKNWDKTRSIHTGNLDAILEQLEAQLVPPDFHHAADSDSLFGSPPSDHDGRTNGVNGVNGRSGAGPSRDDRSRWKTLRDFVHERGIEDATETVDKDRIALDDLLATTEDYPELLRNSIRSINDSLPATAPLPAIEATFKAQGEASENMGHLLESLAQHYESISAALQEKEAGVEFGEDDLQEMNRDTGELPAIIAELEDDVETIKSGHDTLQTTKDELKVALNELCGAMERLDDLAEAMGTMLGQQQNVTADFEIQLASLQSHIDTLQHLHSVYTSYQTSYNGLLVELERRRRYRDTAEEIVRTMTKQLEAMRDEEIQRREKFYGEHGEHLPEDLCLCVGNLPTRWVVSPADGDASEELPEVNEDLLEEAVKRLSLNRNGSQSL